MDESPGGLGVSGKAGGYPGEVGEASRQGEYRASVGVAGWVPGVAARCPGRHLYGSYGTAHQTALSDVDIAVLFYRDRPPDRRRLFALEADVSSICHEDDVNVLSVNDADVMLQFRVLETGRPLLEKDPVAVSEFREYVFSVYGDFEPFYRAFCQDHDRGLREAFPRDRPRQGQVYGQVPKQSRPSLCGH